MKRSRAPSSLAKRSKPTNKETFGAVRIPRSLAPRTGFPKQMKMTHKYCEVINLTMPPGSINTVYGSWGVNCLWDPNLLVGGHQPYYFDQLTPIYNHYIVLSSRLVMELVCTTDVPFTAGVYIDDDSTPARTELQTVMENQSANYKTSRGNAEPIVIKKKWDAKAAFGGNIFDNDSLQGDVASNPIETQAYICFCGEPNSTTTYTVTGTVTIYYDTVWDELKQPTGS